MNGSGSRSLVDSGAALEAPLGFSAPKPLLPDYGGACLSSVVPTLLRRRELADAGVLPAWMPTAVASAEQVVLFVLDGLGHEQLRDRRQQAPVLSAMAGEAITSVAPTTTATALTSIVTGATPAEHGTIGYRLASPEGVLNVLRWTVGGKDARTRVPPAGFRRVPPFLGHNPPVVSRTEFGGSGFTEAHLHGIRLIGWRVPSSIRVEVSRLLAAKEPFVYAYYDGIDKIAHETGLGEHYSAELACTDRLVGDLAAALPPGTALVVTADHGQVEVRSDPIVLDEDLASDVVLLSGEGRFRWLHARPGADERLLEGCRKRYGELAWVRHREELIAEDWFGGTPTPEVAARLGDVALVAYQPVAFYDPADSGELRLIARHGSLTPAEVLVPLLATVV